MEIFPVAPFPGTEPDSAVQPRHQAMPASGTIPGSLPDPLAPPAGPEAITAAIPDLEATCACRLEARFEGEVMKAHLQAETENRQSSTVSPAAGSGSSAAGTSETGNSEAESLAARVLDYFRRHPDAADSLEGVADAWQAYYQDMPGLEAGESHRNG